MNKPKSVADRRGHLHSSKFQTHFAKCERQLISHELIDDMVDTEMDLHSNKLILFQGDSITDAGRNRKNSESLGEGYAMLAAGWVSALHPEYNVEFVNRGISGDQVRDLKSRWKKDCIELKPEFVSILIGVNDAANMPFWSKSTYLDKFKSDYEFVLHATENAGIKIVLMEPFVLPSVQNHAEILSNLMQEIAVIRELSKQFNAKLIPLQSIFEEALKQKDSYYWTLDGVHPTLAGHALIAQAWIAGVVSELALPK